MELVNHQGRITRETALEYNDDKVGQLEEVGQPGYAYKKT